MLTLFGLYFWPYIPKDSNSKVVGNEDDLLVDDTTDSISSVLEKEIEGKVSISKPKGSNSVTEGKNSLGESFVDAKEDLLSTNSLGTFQKEQLLNALQLTPLRQWKLIGKSLIKKGKQQKWMVTSLTIRYHVGVEAQMEDKDTYGFWFFVPEVYSSFFFFFLLLIVPVLVDRVRDFNGKGQSLFLGRFKDTYISSGLWLLICYLIVMVHISFMKIGCVFVG